MSAVWLVHSIVDIRGLSRLARQYGALLSVDNTMMSPYLQKVSQPFTSTLHKQQLFDTRTRLAWPSSLVRSLMVWCSLSSWALTS